MHRVRTSGACFALRGGYPVDETPFAYCRAEHDERRAQASVVLLALVEPLFPAPGAGEAADAVVRQLLAACASSADTSPSQTLVEAFHAANDLLFYENKARALAQRINLGFTAVIVQDSAVTIGQVPPGRLLVRQGDELFVFPPDGNAALTRRGTAQREPERAHPLGLRAQTSPNIFVSRAEAGDLFIALSTELARTVAGNDLRLRQTTNVVETLELVLRASERQFVASGHGAIAVLPAAVSIGRSIELPAVHGYGRIETERGIPDDPTDEFEVGTELFPDTSPLDPLALTGQTKDAHNRREARQGADWSEQHEDHDFTIPSHRGDAGRGTDTGEDDVTVRTAGHSEQQAASIAPGRTGRDDRRTRSVVLTGNAEAFGERRRRSKQNTQTPAGAGARQVGALADTDRPRGTGFVELLAGLILSLTAAVVGAWQVTKRDRPLHGPLDDGSFGLPRLQRWDESYRPPRMQRVRSRLPRLEVSRIVVLVALTLILALSVTYYFSRANSQSQQQTAESLTLLQQAESQRLAANALADPQAAYVELLAAEATLTAVAATDTTDAEQIAGVRAAIAADIARITHSQRLSNVQVVGGVPAAQANRSSQLVIGGSGLYLLADGVYQVDLFTSRLVRLLMPGDTVDGAEVGALLGATWREDRLITTDAMRSYAFDITRGVWVAEPLATIEGADHEGAAAVATFDRNLYLLTPESGQILKFNAGAYDGSLEDWTAGVGTEELKLGIDMAINGNVLVLLNDGRVLDFLRSRLEQTITPQAVPAFESTIAIAAPAGSDYLYLLNATDGRILRMTRDGTIVQQFTSPVTGSVPILSGATDLTIDEVNGIVHVLARDTIYTIRLPAPPEE